MTEPSSHAVLDVRSRQPKAEKIRRLLKPWLGGRRDLRLLEIGTGSGAIAHFFSCLHSQISVVNAIDVRDQRTILDGYEFQLYGGDRFPFEDASFDILISNHVLEHVGDRTAQLRHLCEMKRVLAAAGIGYLATPSRWQLIEPHFHLVGLGWLPRSWRNSYVRLAKRGSKYDCDPLSHREIEVAMRKAGLPFRNRNMKALSTIHDVEGSVSNFGRLLSWLPTRVLERFYRFSPTMVYLVGAVDKGEPDGR